MSKPIRIPAHDSGYTCLAFSKDGSRAFTGGRDCMIRIWKMDEGEGQEPETAPEAEGGVTCIAATDDCWLSGSEDTEVKRYSKDSNQYDAPLTTTNGIPVRSVSIDPKGRRVAVSSDEHVVKVIDMEDIKNIDLLEGYKAGVRSVSWNHAGNLLATCTADGKIIIWNMEAEKPTIEKTLEGLIPAVTDSEAKEFLYDCSVVWQRTGECFYVATRTHEIVQIDTTSWEKVARFTDKNVSGAVTALGISANGAYLASASQSTVFVWSTKSRILVAQQKGTPGDIITKVAFSPKDNLIAWVDAEGAFTRWLKPISDKFPDPVKIHTSTSATNVTAQSRVDLFEDDNLDDTLSGVMEEIADAEDADMNEEEGWIDDDAGLLDEGLEPDREDGIIKEMVSIVKSQDAFQPGSTIGDGRRRYLAFNTIGVIEVTQHDLHNVVNVEVYDRSLRKGFHFQDNHKCDLGYLGERGVVLAYPPTKEYPAAVKFRSYTTWDTYEWSYTLRPKTHCLGIAAGALPLTTETHSSDHELQGYGHVVIATSENDLTFLSGSGRERRIIGLGGEFVTMVAGAEWVFVVYRAGATTIDGHQNLSYCMINFDDFSVRQRDVLPLSKGHTLKWVGITSNGAPATYDSAGYLHVMSKFRIPHHGSWARVLDSNILERRQGKDESYWPVGVTDTNFLCLILKGRQTSPGFPKPLIQELPLQMPFRKSEPKEEFVERELLEIDLLLDTLDEELTTDDILAREKAVDKEVIHLIQAACKASNIPRAIELTKLLHNTVSMELVTKVADFYHLPSFKQKVNTIKADREEAEDRLIAARNKRRKWLKATAAPRQVMGPPNGSGYGRYDPLGDTRPPPVIERPGLARVVAPVIEKTQYSSQGTTNGRGVTPDASNNWDETFVESPPDSGKRKRMDMDVDDDGYTIDSGPSSLPPPPPKQKTNPFARKPVAESIKSNPFARRNDSIKLQKSDSFFDKVDAAEDKRSQSTKKKSDKGADKTASSSSNKSTEKGRQTTLFSMMPKSTTAPTRKSKLSTCLDVEPETQGSDVTMTDAVEETQLVDDETQRAGSPEWDETQLDDDATESIPA